MDKEFLKKILEEELAIGVEQIREAIRQNSIYSTGRTGRSLSVRTYDLKNKMKGTIETPLAWFPALEHGRGPYRGGPKSGFKEAMIRWAIGAGIKPKKGTIEGWAIGYCLRVNRMGNPLFLSKKQRMIYTPILKRIVGRIKSRLNMYDYGGLEFGGVMRELSFNKPIKMKV